MAINPFGGCVVSAPTPVAAIPLTVSIPFWQASVSTAEVLLETARKNFVELSQQVAAKAVHGMAQKVATIKNKLASFTKARKAIDIAEDAASTFGKAGSHRAGPGKLKAIQDFFRNRRIACGGRGCNLPDNPLSGSGMGTTKWMKFTKKLRSFGYTDDVIDSIYDGMRRGVIDRSRVNPEKLAKFEHLSRKAGWAEGGINPSKKIHRLERMFNAKDGTSTRIFKPDGNPYDDLDNAAILKYGDDAKGYKHIFEFDAGSGKTRAQQMMEIFPDLKNEKDVLDRIQDVLSNGNELNGDYYKFFPDKRGGGLETPFKVGLSSDSPGAIQTIKPSLT